MKPSRKTTWRRSLGRKSGIVGGGSSNRGIGGGTLEGGRGGSSKSRDGERGEWEEAEVTGYGGDGCGDDNGGEVTMVWGWGGGGGDGDGGVLMMERRKWRQ